MTRRRWMTVALVVVGLLALSVLTLPITLTPGLRSRLTSALSERFDSDVEIGDLRVSALPHLRVAGNDVVLRHKGRTDVPPLIRIAAFSAEANLFGLLGDPLRLRRVHLEGLEINVPPGGMDGKDDKEEPGDTKTPPDQARRADAPSPPAPPPPRRDTRATKDSPLIVDALLSERAVLRLLRREPGKEPRVFEIARLEMEDVGAATPWGFEATLTNPMPPGRIETRGTFGPWNATRPGATPLEASYEFHDANLGAINGISGVLQSAGEFDGVLERIEVTGRADVADFALKAVGRPVPLETRFHSIVDGTSGNTWLQPVHAKLRGSPIEAKGGIVEREGEDGRTIELDVLMKGAKVDDVLALAVKTKEPPLTGDLTLDTKFRLPPGEADAIERLFLDGTFQIARAQFTTGTIQSKVDELSKKARGEGAAPGKADRVVSDFTGRFVMKGGTIHFSKVTFGVPGARLELAGRYTLRTEALDFRGTVRLDAKLSELTTGVKSFLLKAIDPLMRRKDVTIIPVTISGTVDKPKFGLDIRRALTPG